jgi:phosphatidylethanolamine-binding protein (PEBP) family uncharacterized protein
MRDGLNDFRRFFANDSKMRGEYYGYDGPAPPWNDKLAHRYIFTLHATDVSHLEVNGILTGANIARALASHVLKQATLTGLYALNPDIGGAYPGRVTLVGSSPSSNWFRPERRG